MQRSFPAFFLFWSRIGALGFGGPAGQIALMHREVVTRARLLAEQEFLRALNFCMLLPGPEAQQLSVWCGWRERGIWGGLVAGLMFIIPGALVIALLTVMTIMGVTNHMGWDLFPRALVHGPAGRWLITATHHQLHHDRYACNYGLYFRLWDRLCGTDGGLGRFRDLSETAR